MSIEIDIQYATNINELPEKELIQKWVKSSLENDVKDADITVRIVDEDEGKLLNEKWRKSNGATNVLSFPYNKSNDDNIHGDIILCAPVIIHEATEQKKTVEAHWAHMVVHGSLHLMGYDHIEKTDAKKMESLEILILQMLNYPDPYLSE